MVRLFWNTHNQINNNTNNKKNAADHLWGIYHKENSNLWIKEILKGVEYSITESEKNIENGDVLIIVDSSIEKKIEQYKKLKLICSKIFLFHLGDESALHDLTDVYKNFDYVWRTFCHNKYFNSKLVQCIPVGYKSGVSDKKIASKKYKWAFIGTPHKSSRHDLLFQLSSIKENFCHKTEQFNKKIISVDTMSEVLSSTEFLPCPNGFVHPETYRVYEALECGCIPIVENAYKYYDRLFPNNPFIKIDKWSEAKDLVKDWTGDQIIKKQKECKIWWDKYKIEIQNFIGKKIN